MLAMSPDARDMARRVRQAIGPAAWRVFEHRWARDTRYELLAACHCLRHGARFERHSLRNLNFMRLAVAADGQTYAGDYEQWSLVWHAPDASMTVVMFPQVRLLAPDNGGLYRVDYLLWVKVPNLPPFFVVLEIDGEYHEHKPSQDRTRTSVLRLPEIRAENVTVSRHDFFQWLLDQLGWMVQRRLQKAQAKAEAQARAAADLAQALDTAHAESQVHPNRSQPAIRATHNAHQAQPHLAQPQSARPTSAEL